mmetsp:Transcript_3064/g.11687  ORF Transcript_3064/g.11687 Transcript_3064/m.11687 type:complete len:426 (-) Transcript_3064:1368-2645(-)
MRKCDFCRAPGAKFRCHKCQVSLACGSGSLCGRRAPTMSRGPCVSPHAMQRAGGVVLRQDVRAARVAAPQDPLHGRPRMPPVPRKNKKPSIEGDLLVAHQQQQQQPTLFTTRADAAATRVGRDVGRASVPARAAVDRRRARRRRVLRVPRRRRRRGGVGRRARAQLRVPRPERGLCARRVPRRDGDARRVDPARRRRGTQPVGVLLDVPSALHGLARVGPLPPALASPPRCRRLVARGQGPRPRQPRDRAFVIRRGRRRRGAPRDVAPRARHRGPRLGEPHQVRARPRRRAHQLGARARGARDDEAAQAQDRQVRRPQRARRAAQAVRGRHDGGVREDWPLRRRAPLRRRNRRARAQVQGRRVGRGAARVARPRADADAPGPRQRSQSLGRQAPRHANASPRGRPSGDLRHLALPRHARRGAPGQ